MYGKVQGRPFLRLCSIGKLERVVRFWSSSTREIVEVGVEGILPSTREWSKLR